MSSVRFVTYVSGLDIEIIGGRTRTRTLDLLIKSPSAFLINQWVRIKALDLPGYRQVMDLGPNCKVVLWPKTSQRGTCSVAI